jgi:hypothetical protein
MDPTDEMNYFDFYNAASGRVTLYSDMKSGNIELQNKIKIEFGLIGVECYTHFKQRDNKYS